MFMRGVRWDLVRPLPPEHGRSTTTNSASNPALTAARCPASALARVWQAERFSWWFTALTHRFPETDGFSRRLQMAELDYLLSSKTAQTALAKNYVGLPLD